MGTFLFKWTKPAEEVLVTGTFDNWNKSIKLEKENGIFAKLVDLPISDTPILYKYVVDGNWAIDPDHTTKDDESGIENNVLNKEDITPAGSRSMAGPHPALLSGVAGGATTAALAGEVPTEASKEVPGAFPEDDDDDFAPGDMVPDYSRYAAKAGDQTVSVNPLPATAGTGNPIDLKPGEKVPAPSEFTTNTVDSNVKLDKESYEKSDAYPTESKGPIAAAVAAGAAGLTAIGATIFPETGSSTGANKEQNDATAAEASAAAAAGPTISSSGAGTTTADLAGQVPLEPRGTAVVEDDISKDADTSSSAAPGLLSAGAGTTTAALAGEQPIEPRGVPQIVDESQVDAQVTQPSDETAANKADVVEEIKDKVPEKEGESTTSQGILGAAAATGAAAIGGVAAAATGLFGGGKHQDTADDTADAVPETVKESIETAGASPEAAANPEAVEDKKALEAQLLKDGPTIADEDTAPAIAAATGASTVGNPDASKEAGTLGAATDVEAFKSDPVSAPGAAGTTTSTPSAAVAAFASDPVSPETSKTTTSSKAATSSTAAAATSSTAAAAAAPSTTTTTPAAPSTATTSAPTGPIATSSLTKDAPLPVPAPTSDARAREPSRDISPHSKPAGKISSPSANPAAPAAGPASARPQTSASEVADKKAKRRSFFGRIKDKVTHRDGK